MAMGSRTEGSGKLALKQLRKRAERTDEHITQRWGKVQEGTHDDRGG